jgi:ABC-2 type transport system permease protein
MNKLWVIARKDIGEAFRSRSTYVFVLVMAVLAFSYFSTYTGLINNLIGENASKQIIIEASRSFMNNIANALPMMYSIFICSIFANYSVIMDKAKHNIESLMVTPVSLKQIWMGKSLAVTLPSIMVGIGVAVLAYVGMNFGFVIPQTGVFIVPDALAIVSALVFVPVLIFSIVAVVIYVQLVVSNPRIGNLVFTGIFLILLLGVNVLGGLGIEVNFGEIYSGVIVLCAVISFLLSRSLTKEKVLLSSKG